MLDLLQFPEEERRPYSPPPTCQGQSSNRRTQVHVHPPFLDGSGGFPVHPLIHVRGTRQTGGRRYTSPPFPRWGWGFPCSSPPTCQGQ